jgi:hypothetical protein
LWPGFAPLLQKPTAVKSVGFLRGGERATIAYLEFARTAQATQALVELKELLWGGDTMPQGGPRLLCAGSLIAIVEAKVLSVALAVSQQLIKAGPVQDGGSANEEGVLPENPNESVTTLLRKQKDKTAAEPATAPVLSPAKAAALKLAERLFLLGATEAKRGRKGPAFVALRSCLSAAKKAGPDQVLHYRAAIAQSDALRPLRTDPRIRKLLSAK